MTITLTLQSAYTGNTDIGPFTVSGTTNGGSLNGVNMTTGSISRAQLTSGWSYNDANDTITGGTINSSGTCITGKTWTVSPPPTPTPTPIPSTYDCVSGTCVEVEGAGGLYLSLSACQADCTVNPCFIEGTNITLADGSQVLIETLQVGDVLKSFAIDTLPLYSDDDTVLTTWNTENLTGIGSTASIVSITPVQVSEIVVINNLLKTTPTHKHLVKHDGVWSFVSAYNVVVGDTMIDINNNEVEIISVEVQEVEKTVYKMDVETLDVFYAENVLTHNIKPEETRYNCTSQSCVAAVDGQYATLTECNNSGCVQVPN
jgi:hypothetical protein